MTDSTFQFRPAARTRVKLKVGIQGPSGSGKTLGALALATNFLAAYKPNGRIAVIDTENESSAYYADRFKFDILSLRPPYTSARYIAAINLAIEEDYDVAIVDSTSHQWAGTGGILERKDAVDAHGGNQWTNWGPFTKEHERFKASLLEAPIHLIATLRSKQDYILEQSDKGKQVPKKVGMAPVQREGMEYEFGIVFELQMDHKAVISKDRTDLFNESGSLWQKVFGGATLFDLASPKVGKALAQWLTSAKPAPEPRKITEESIAAMTVAQALLIGCPGGDRLGSPLGNFRTDELEDMYEKLTAKLAFADNPNMAWAEAAHAMKLIIADRAEDPFKEDPLGAANAVLDEAAASIEREPALPTI
jgi:hypothetical protein